MDEKSSEIGYSQSLLQFEVSWGFGYCELGNLGAIFAFFAIVY